MNLKHLILFLILEILSAVTAVLGFRFVHDRLGAILVAGTGFMIVGLVVVIKSWRWLDKYYSLTFWLGHAHLWLTSLPLFLNRLVYGNDFTKNEVFGLPVAVIHKYATTIFYLLLAATVIDIMRVALKKFRTGR
ncbi:MAG: hypothetical protein H6626_07810 [Pseudobdellovibrionaceae bacterium]|nr:hypothetical protein [Bdellovibrionales bacterium]USN46131.1 MAG: hypothetical protein H6626_07810 [Pseudobdellovibrionaceae bacterium]